jgi:hypothetical protein
LGLKINYPLPPIFHRLCQQIVFIYEKYRKLYAGEDFCFKGFIGFNGKGWGEMGLVETPHIQTLRK